MMMMNDRKTAEEALRENDPDVGHEEAHRHGTHPYQHDTGDNDERRDITTDPEGQGFTGDRPNDVDDAHDTATTTHGTTSHDGVHRDGDGDGEPGVLGDHRDGLHDDVADNDRDRDGLHDVAGNDRDRDRDGLHDDAVANDNDRDGLHDVADHDRDGQLHDVTDNDRDRLHDDTGATVDHHDDLQGDRDEMLVPSQRTADVTPGASPGDVLIAGDENQHVPAHAVPYQGQNQAQNLELFDQDTTQLRERWRDVQSGFVDEPRESVERADSLIDEVVTALTTALSTRTNELRDRWKNAGDNDTEQLRLALRDYRQVLERLMSLSSTEGR